MANSLVTIVDHDGATNVRQRVTGIIDTADITVVTAITNIASLVPAPTFLRLDAVQWAIDDAFSIRLWWMDTANTLIMPLSSRSHFHLEWYGGVTNPKNAGVTGNIGLTTLGWATGKVLAFTLLLDFTKQGV